MEIKNCKYVLNTYIYTKSNYSRDPIEKEILSLAKDSGHIASRIALYRALKSEKIPIKKMNDLKITEDFKLKELHSISFSLSHTKNIGAALLSKSNDISIGLDIEWEGRKFNDETQRHFINSQDQLNNTNLLKVWCAKEASFKALWKFLNRRNALPRKSLVLKDISLEIDKNNFKFFFKNFCGSGSLNFFNNYIYSISEIHF